MTNSKKNYILLVVVAACLLLASVGATADPDESNSPGAGVQQVTETEAEVRAAMAVFDRQRGSGDALSEWLAGKLDAAAEFGMNPALSRLSIGNATNSLYAVPARGHVCAVLTVGEGASVSCPPTGDVAAGRSAPSTVALATGDVAIYGIVPNAVESVSVQTGPSESTKVDVEGNAYYTVVSAGTPLKTVRYAGPSGSVEFPIYDPQLVRDG
ncbi:MAG TPA: hypothetical protein VHF90_04575 [Thermoleophilaceae bacterium]|nr:hypothetical protein [Thermoleophilaceae bacterium]